MSGVLTAATAYALMLGSRDSTSLAWFVACVNRSCTAVSSFLWAMDHVSKSRQKDQDPNSLHVASQGLLDDSSS